VSAVHLDIEGAVAVLRLDNPAKLNALTPEMLSALASHCDTLEQIAEVRVVLLTGNHPKAFCVGADISAWAGLSPAGFARTWVRGGHRVFDRLARLSKPTIAVLNGHAFGGGLELAAACDIRVMAPKARIALPEASVGVVPGWSGTQLAMEIAGATAQLSPRATEISKNMIHAGAGEDSAALIEALGGGLIAGSDDKAEGVAAFAAKRTPDFSGK
jgi:enoyl-CoA hydratase/carnithine racemase